MLAAKIAIEHACRTFMEQDDTDPELTKHLEDLKRIKAEVGDRMANAVKELNTVKNIFKRFENRQRGKNGKQLSKSTKFYESLCAIDTLKMN